MQRQPIIIGAGLSGLACAHECVRNGVEPIVLEAGDHPGGVVGTSENDGFLFEHGPNTIQAGAAEFRTLCSELGLAHRLIATPKSAAERYLFSNSGLVKLPATPPELLATSLLGWRDKLFLCSEPLRRWRPPREEIDEPDLETVLVERLGARATRLFAGSFVRGVYAAELSQLGARSAFPRLWRALVEHGSLVRALRSAQKMPLDRLPGPDVARSALLSFPRGMQELVDALARTLGERLRLRCPASAMMRTESGWRVTSARGAFDSDAVVLAVPASVAGHLLGPVAGAAVPLESLRAIEHARVTLVHLGLEREQLPGFPEGFGYLVPPPAHNDRRPMQEQGTFAPDGKRVTRPLCLGTIFASNLFPGRAPQDCVAISSFYQGADVESMQEQELIEQAARDLACALGIQRAPRIRTGSIRTWNDVIPRYAPGHVQRMQELEQAIDVNLPGVSLAGSYIGGVSVDNVLAHGRAVARRLCGLEERMKVGA